MMERDVLKDIGRDLQGAAAGRNVVLYLEGITDVPILLALLGAEGEREVGDGVLYDGVLIRGLPARSGSGSSAVAQRLELAQRHDYPGIFGVLDGDGKPLSALAAEFDAPHAGPQFRWRGYCIENLLVRAGWPPQWGNIPDWHAVFATYAPYVAINRLVLEIRDILQELGLGRFLHPGRAQTLVTADQLLDRLEDGKARLANRDVAAMFTAELQAFQDALARDLNEAQALLNGKWLVEVFAARHTGRSQDRCRDTWVDHVRERGGDPEIKAWWRRTIARS